MRISDLNNEERIINGTSALYVARDLLEDAVFFREYKRDVNRCLKSLNRLLNQIAANREVWEELDKLQEHFYDNFVREKK